MTSPERIDYTCAEDYQRALEDDAFMREEWERYEQERQYDYALAVQEQEADHE